MDVGVVQTAHPQTPSAEQGSVPGTRKNIL